MADFDVYQGEDVLLGISVALEGIMDTTDNAEFFFDMFSQKGQAEDLAVVSKSTVDDSVQAVPPKEFRWRLSAEELAGLTLDRHYYWYARYQDAQGNRHMLDEGSVTMRVGVKVSA